MCWVSILGAVAEFETDLTKERKRIRVDRAILYLAMAEGHASK